MKKHLCPKRGICLALLSGLIVAVTAPAGVTSTAHGSIPGGPTFNARQDGRVLFIRNDGQWDAQVRYRAAMADAVIWVCDDGVYYEFYDSQTLMPSSHDAPFDYHAVARTIVHAQFVAANPHPKMSADGLLASNTNYFIGNDPSRWSRNVPAYASVTYRNLYEGIDLELTGDAHQLHVRYHARAGADLSQVQLRYAGDKPLTRLDNGGASVSLPQATFHLAATEEIAGGDGVLLAIDRAWPLLPPSLATGTADAQASNVLTLVNSTYLGGSGGDVGYGVVADGAGAMYVCGYTFSSNFPIEMPYDSTSNLGLDVFVSKLSPDGTALEYSTYLGGNDEDWAFGLAVDSGGYAYVTGHTGSTAFPLMNPYDNSHNGGLDAFLTKLTPAGDSLVYSTYFGGNDEDNGWGVVVDTLGIAVITGFTRSTDMPMVNAIDPSQNGQTDAFVAAFSASGDALLYSTYLGGTGQEEAHAIGQGAGSIYITGWTNSTDFQTVAPLDDSYNGGDADVFLARLQPGGAGWVYATYFGGSDIEWSFAIDVDSAGCAYISGPESSTDLPVTTGSFDTDQNGAQDAFVAKFAPDGDSVIYCTYVGGTGVDFSHAIAVDKAGRVCVTGHTTSTDFPTVNPFDGSQNGSQDIFVTLLTPDGSAATYSTYVGGSGDEHIWAMSDDGEGNFWCTGMTTSPDFPTRNAFDNSFNNSSDVFILKFSPCDCPHQSDLDASGFPDGIDLNLLIDALFFGGEDPRDLFCPVSRGDFDISGQIDALDLNLMIDYLFFSGAAPQDPCASQ